MNLERWGDSPDRARVAVLAVHGRDQDPGYLREVAGRVALPGVAWCGPAAPGRSWYPGRFMQEREANEPQLSEALGTVDAVLDVLAGEGFPAQRVVLLGFSQGACLLAEHLVTRPRRYAAAALLTGGFVGPPGFRPAPRDGLARMPVLLASSSRDGWVPVERVRETADVLRGMDADVTLRVDDDAEHHVNDATAGAVRELLVGARPDGEA